MSDYVERLEALLDARPETDGRESSDIILTLQDPNPNRGRWLHLTGADLREALNELKQLRAERATAQERPAAIQPCACGCTGDPNNCTCGGACRCGNDCPICDPLAAIRNPDGAHQ